jgi:hypothetical protein
MINDHNLTFMQNMVTFYGAGERTGIMNVEGKLAKVLGKETDTLVVKAADRDTVLNEISAQIAKYEKFDMDTANQLRQLRVDVRDVFNKGIDPGNDIMEQLWFLDSATKDLVEKLSGTYTRVVTPEDFKAIAKIMSKHLSEEVPILKSFTKYFGRLAEDFLANAKPSKANFDWTTIAKQRLLGTKSKTLVLNNRVSRFLGIDPKKPVSLQFLEKLGFFKNKGTLYNLVYGVPDPEIRRTGAKFFGMEIRYPTLNLKGGKKEIIPEYEFLSANKMPKSWTNVPWVNFDGKVLEQNFTQVFEERLRYQDRDGNWVTNILQVPQKTESTWWEQAVNKSGKINDIADATKARTAFAVNGNHSNDAVIVKRFHLWGAKNGIPTSTIHDAFFANAADMMEARRGLRQIYANTLEKNVIKMVLDEMKARGLPRDLYNKYLNEAIESGLIPIPGKSRIDGRLMRDTDILLREDILKEISDDFSKDLGFYGVG